MICNILANSETKSWLICNLAEGWWAGEQITSISCWSWGTKWSDSPWAAGILLEQAFGHPGWQLCLRAICAFPGMWVETAWGGICLQGYEKAGSWLTKWSEQENCHPEHFGVVNILKPGFTLKRTLVNWAQTFSLELPKSPLLLLCITSYSTTTSIALCSIKI